MKTCIIFIIGFSFLFQSCATQPVYVWTKPGGDYEQFKRDQFDCVERSRVHWAGGGTGVPGIAIMLSAKHRASEQSKELFKMCMEAHGYIGREKRKGDQTKP